MLYTILPTGDSFEVHQQGCHHLLYDTSILVRSSSAESAAALFTEAAGEMNYPCGATRKQVTRWLKLAEDTLANRLYIQK